MTAPLHVNFTEKEASSEAFDVLPRGKYHVKVTDVEPRESKSEKNAGKPYWHVEFTIQDGPHTNRKLWTNVMLFEGALYSLKQLMAAAGADVSAGKVAVPDAEFFIGKDALVTVTIKPATDDYDERNEIRGIAPWKVGAVAGKGGKSSLMP